MQAKDGNLYGTTQGGGAFGGGTIFKLTPGGVLTTLHSFDRLTDGCNPSAALIQAKDGNVYGTTRDGGISEGGMTGSGTIFKLTPGGVLTTLHVFDFRSSPGAALMQASNGTLHGTTPGGPDLFGGGTVFKLPLGGAVTTLHAFDCSTEGCGPLAAVIQAKDGHLYGTTQSGGASGVGTVFKLTPGGVLSTLHAFDCGTEGAASPSPPSFRPATATSMAPPRAAARSEASAAVFKLTPRRRCHDGARLRLQHRGLPDPHPASSRPATAASMAPPATSAGPEAARSSR